VAQLVSAVREIVIITCLTVASAALPTAAAETITLVPSKDNTIIQWSPATPDPNPLLSNGLGDIFVGRTNQDGQEPATISIRRGLIHFDVAERIPAGAQITAATLTMRDVRGLNGDPTVRLHRVLQDWGEGNSFFQGGQGAPAADGDVTWLHRFYSSANPAASTAWDYAGGDYAAMSSAESVIFDDQGDGQLFTWSSPTMAVDVRDWLDNPNENFGWMLIGDEARGQSAKRLNSRESTELPNMPPNLMIEYEPVFAGDYNDDGRVDVVDYVVWRKRLGDSTALMNETETPGHVTPEDYGVWRAQFGAFTAQTERLPAVPEANGLQLAAVAAICLCGATRQPIRLFA
jgi:hypothetical protein